MAWNVLEIDGNDAAACEQALTQARASQDKPTLIIGHTHIGQGSPNKHDTHKAHGEPLGVDEVKATKAALGMPVDQDFYVPAEVVCAVRRARRGTRRAEQGLEAEPRRVAAGASGAVAGVGRPPATQAAGRSRKRPAGLRSAKPLATRQASGETLNALAKVLPHLIGGSADLAPSTNTMLKGLPSVGKRQFLGRNLHFGVREHGMLGVINA